MIGAIGDTLPLAVGIAISPVPVIAVILMLLSPGARATSVGFMAGWVAGVTVAVVGFELVAGVLPDDGSAGGGVAGGATKVVLGLGLVVLAVRQWRARPGPGEAAEMPAWMAATDSLSAVRAAGLAFVLAAANPKNLLLAASAGLLLAEVEDPGGQVGATVVFVLIAAISVALPVVSYLVAADRLARPLEVLRSWLVANNATTMSTVLFVLGTVTFGKGLAALG
ncbi:MAG: GAP family protein [Cellulomonas sp.]|nr:GAP family protein [Cellulomonas sp.]